MDANKMDMIPDKEIEALRLIVPVLETLDEDKQVRVMEYLEARYLYDYTEDDSEEEEDEEEEEIDDDDFDTPKEAKTVSRRRT